MSFRHAKHKVEQHGYSDVSCDACGEPLEPVFEEAVDEAGVWESLQATRSLHLYLDGGFGEFVDTIDNQSDDLHFILCEPCAKKLIAENPWLKVKVFECIHTGIGHICDDEKQAWVALANCRRYNHEGN